MRIVFVAHADGLGHLARCIGVARQLRKVAPDAEIEIAALRETGWIVRQEGLGLIPLGRRQMAGIEGQVDAVICDMAWPWLRRMTPWLEAFEGLKVMIYRDSAGEVPFALFDEIVRPLNSARGPGVDKRPPAAKSHLVGAILPRELKELEDSPALALEIWGGSPRPWIAVYHGGFPGEARLLFPKVEQALAGMGTARYFSFWPTDPFPSRTYWPMIELLVDVDLAISAGGNQSVAEQKAWAIPAVNVPLRRAGGEQEQRVGKPGDLGQAIVSGLNSRVQLHDGNEFSGANVAAQVIWERLGGD